MTRRHYRPAYHWLDVLGLIHRGPRTIAELITLTGCSRQTVGRYLKALREENLVRCTGKPRQWCFVEPTPVVEPIVDAESTDRFAACGSCDDRFVCHFFGTCALDLAKHAVAKKQQV